MLELPSKEDGKDGLSSISKWQESTKSFLLVERRKRRKKETKRDNLHFLESKTRDDILFHSPFGNRSSCYTQNSHVFVAKCRVRLLLIACTLVHLIRESDRGCGKRK